MSMSPRLLRPRASGFNPKSISGLAGWWDFNDAATVTVQTGISSVLDKSGNGRTLLQTTTNNQPAWTANAINGKYAAVFDGMNDTLGASFTLAQPCHHFIVFKFNTAYVSGNPRVFDGYGASAGFTRASAISMVTNYGGSNDNAAVTDLEMQSFAVWDIEANGASSFIRSSGVRRDSTDTSIGTSAPSGIYLAVFNNGFSAPGNISVAEVLIYSQALSAASATKVREYLGKKFNLAYA
jgi:hypothetical protein